MREQVLRERFGVSARDLPTRDKIPVIQQVMAGQDGGLALDIGSGTGYTTYRVFGNRPTVCVDIHAPNLRDCRSRIASIHGAHQPFFVVAQATALPFRAGKFSVILCSEVLEHLEDDDAAVREMARLLAHGGMVVITVPYLGLGFTSFLELCGIKTVHDFPGPERHVRPGYDEHSLRRLLTRHGLELAHHTFYLRFFTKLATDAVSVVHLVYQRVVYRRCTWSWSEITAEEGGVAFRLYAWVFPVLWAFCRLDRWLGRRRGFGLVAVARKHDG